MPQQRVYVPGADHLQHAGGEVGFGVGAGCEAVRVQFLQEGGGTRHDGGRGVALGGVGPQHDAQLAHDGGGMGVVALDVADDGADAAAGQRDHVVPVAADVPAHPGGAVADGDLGAGDVGDAARQHGLLQALGEVVLLVEEHGAGDALGEAGAQGDEEVPLLLGEAARVPVEQAEGTDGAGVGDQGEVGGGADADVPDALPQPGVGGGELPGGTR
ncbi:hypothetical protein GCM10020000_69710 [Streptomyces olivoverticillatus]